MDRPPYPVRVAAGIVVTVLEETRKLPMAAITLPMTAISNTVSAAMKLQQNIAEMAIKGDEVFDTLIPATDEQPAWATFDEDDDLPSDEAVLGQLNAMSAKLAATPKPTPTTEPADDSAPEPEAPTDKPAPAKKAAAKKAAPAKKAPAKKAAAKKAAPAKKAASKPADDDADTASSAGPGTGRFALYSSAPDLPDAKPTPAAPAGDAPEAAQLIDYDTLTLAQLRAKLKAVPADDYPALAEYERRTKNRAPFVTMLDNRIAAASKK
ncbi:lipid droplet-associated protein [Jongsikchunia kroppenstedtii]|uniref:lipid droplet-associated protein n=1 Tax=Jongsikchunia kroppenstedtii TaxID=1121721 RepID=UPI00035D2718|nr:lipid droplet-associated protein [Jongsikchunia kroppenstedtii]